MSSRHRGHPYLVMGPGGKFRRCYTGEDLARIRLRPWLIGGAGLAVLTIAAAVAWGADPNALRPTPYALRPLFSAIRQVESGGDCNAIGDGGLARGPYQIHLIWWLDCGGTRASYAAGVTNRAACEERIMETWRRRCPAALAAGNMEILARTFRLPRSPWRKSNDDYWRRVKAAMAG